MFIHRCNVRYWKINNCRNWVILKTGQCNQRDFGLTLTWTRERERWQVGHLMPWPFQGTWARWGLSCSVTEVFTAAIIVRIEPTAHNNIDLVLPSGPWWSPHASQTKLYFLWVAFSTESRECSLCSSPGFLWAPAWVCVSPCTCWVSNSAALSHVCREESSDKGVPVSPSWSPEPWQEQILSTTLSSKTAWSFKHKCVNFFNIWKK